jgi:15-cis-phytoene synthase
MNNLMSSDAVRKDFVECRAYTRQFAKTFYFASHALPRQKRMAAYALYAFCRYADEITDSDEAVADPRTALRELAFLRDRLAAVYSPVQMTVPKFMAFQATVKEYGIPEEYFLDLIRGVEMDLMKKRYRHFNELDEYCYCVASTVGLIMTKVFGAVGEERALEHAAELGKAMQLTNILRDIGEDFRRGRLYLPTEEMEQFGVREQDLQTGIVTPGFVELMKFQIRRARVLYKRADAGIPRLTDDGSRFCVRLMSRTYAQILSAIEANGYDTLSRRAFVPLKGKLSIAAKAFLEKEPAVIHANVHTLETTLPAVQPCREGGSSHVLR